MTQHDPWPCRRRRRRRLLLAACGGGGPRRRRRQAHRRQGRARRCSTTSPASTRTCPARTPSRRVKMAIDDYKAKYGDKAVAKNIEVDHRRPPEQARRRQHQGPGDVRPAEAPTSSSTCRPRRPRWRSPTSAKAKKKLYINIGAGDHRPDRRAVQQVHVPLRATTPTCSPTAPAPPITEDGRQELVHRLPRLRLRPGHEEVASPSRDQGGRRHGRGSDPTPFPNDNFSTFLPRRRR